MYKAELQTKNITPWINTKQFIIIHHTWTAHWTINWVLNTLTKWAVSCHYVVDINWDKYKIWNTDNILWHAWISKWWKYNWMNKYSLGIEVVWWVGEEFPFEQRSSVKELIQHLMATFNIPKENVLRHRDLTHAWSSKWILWDWVSKSRKTDIDKKFYQPKYADWRTYQNSLIPKKIK